jgi:hypothetical protein
MRNSLTIGAAIAVIGASLTLATAANADGVSIGVGPVGVGIGVGGPAPAYYYGPGYYPPGPCASYSYYYDGDCGYPVYAGNVDFDGVVVGGPHYYRWEDDHPVFWYRGGWHTWHDWDRTRWNWEHRDRDDR